MNRTGRRSVISGLVLGTLVATTAAAVSSAYLAPTTAFGPITASGNCSTRGTAEQGPRDDADAQLAGFLTTAARDTHVTTLFPDADVGSLGSTPYVLAFPDTDVTVSIALHNISAADAAGATSTDPMSWGSPATGSDPDLLFGSTEQLQNCAPKPSRLVSTAEPGGALASPTAYWNVTGFGSTADQSTLDSAFFVFSEPVDNFGAWFGDLETRADDVGNGDGGELGVLKLYDAAGAVLSVEPIVPNVQTPIAPATPFGCGGSSSGDTSACGNHGTRFLGFTWDTPAVSAFQVIVGDDDHCVEVPAGCDGTTERLSFIGPTYAFDNPELTFEKLVINDNFGSASPADFQFALTADPNGTPTVTTHSNGDTVELQIGTEYSVAEVAAPGYSNTSVSCLTDEGSQTGNVDVPVSESGFTASLGNARFACTFTNDDDLIAVPLTITKVVTNDDGGTAQPDDFELSVTIDATTTVVNSGATIDLTSPAAVTVSETPPTGYSLVSIECTDAAANSLGSTFVPTVAMENVECIVTNDDVPPATTTTTNATTTTTTTVAATTTTTTATATTVPATTVAPTTELPATGSSQESSLQLGLLALALGAGLLGTARRRSSTSYSK